MIVFNTRFIIFLKNICVELQANRFRFVHVNAVKTIKSFRSIPRLPQVPFLGNWHLYKFGIYNKEKYHEVLKHLYEKYGPIVYERIGSQKPIIHVFEPEDVEIVYRNEDKMPKIFPLSNFTKMYRKKEGLSMGLGNTNDEDWYRLKNGVRHLMMKTNSIEQFFDVVETVTDDLVTTIRNEQNNNGRVQNLYQLLGRWSQEVAGKICFGVRLGYLCGPNIELGKKIVNANRVVFHLGSLLKFSLPIYNYVRTPKLIRLMENERIVYSTAIQNVCEALSQIEKYVGSNDQNREKFLFLLTLLQKPELSRDDVKIITTSLFVDGLSTTVPTLMNNLYALAINENVQCKAYEEICSLPNDRNKIDSHSLNKLTYLKAVIKETFRMYPNGSEVARINKKPLVLSEYYIPPESNLSLNLLVHFMSKKYFSEPHVFRPERWIRSSRDSNINFFVLTPFGFGARTCAGRKFAEQDLLVSLYKILKNFRLSYDSNESPIDFAFQTLIFPNNDLPIHFISR